MPYVPHALKVKHEDLVKQLYKTNVDSEGELNYLITHLIQSYLPAKQERKYRDYNAAMGALESAKLELYRRVVAIYEDGKKYENGDVY